MYLHNIGKYSIELLPLSNNIYLKNIQYVRWSLDSSKQAIGFL